MWLGRSLLERLGAWNATLVAAGSYVVAVADRDADPADHRRDAGTALDDAGNIVYEGFPADDPLRVPALYSLGTQFVMWATIGLVFAALASRLLGEVSKRKETYLPA